MLSATALLDFEQKWGKHSGWKEEAIRRELDIAPARYYQLLDRVIDSEEALALQPILVHRLQDRRTAARASRRG
jgi:hypothetical protein